MGILSFKEAANQEIALGINSKKSRRKLPVELHRNALKKFQIIRAAKQLEDIANFPGLRFEKLKGKRKDEYSVRINDQYRICFKWNSKDAFNVSIEDYHS